MSGTAGSHYSFSLSGPLVMFTLSCMQVAGAAWSAPGEPQLLHIQLFQLDEWVSAQPVRTSLHVVSLHPCLYSHVTGALVMNSMT